VSKLGPEYLLSLLFFNDPDTDLVLYALYRKRDMLKHGFLIGFCIQCEDKDLFFIDPFCTFVGVGGFDGWAASGEREYLLTNDLIVRETLEPWL
jgi:hypothetical protein